MKANLSTSGSLAFSTLLLLVFDALPIDAATVTWTNLSGGGWNVAANWNPNQVPGSGDTAVITATGTYTVTADTSPTVATLTLGGADGRQTLAHAGQSLTVTGSAAVLPNGVWELNGGGLRCEGILTVNGLFLWESGIFRGTLAVAQAGKLSVTSGGDHEFVGILNNAGTIAWEGGRFYLENATTLNNGPGATFVTGTDQQILPAGTGPNRFNNQGMFRKSTATGVTSIEVDFTNTGTVEVLSGTLFFPNGFTSSGPFNVAAQGRVVLNHGVFTFNSGHGFTGAGFYGIEGGDPQLVGDLTASNFQLRSGTLHGSNRLTGTLHWSGGLIQGDFSVAPGGLLSVESGGDHEFVGLLNNAGTIAWAGGRFYLENATTLNNAPGATFEMDSDQAILPAGSGPNRFINRGLFRKSTATGVTSIEVDFTNTGTVEVLSGTLYFPNGFTSSGPFNVAAQGRVVLNHGVFTFNPGHAFTGAGFYGIEGGDPQLVGDLTASNFQLTAGTLHGTNRLTGTLNWSRGLIAGDLSVAPGGLLAVVSGGGDHEFVGNLANGGTVRWTGGGRIYLENGSTLDNLPGGVFAAESQSSLESSGTGPNRFLNRGLFRRSTTPDSITVTTEFVNSGSVEVQTGTLVFAGGFTQTSGTTLLAGGDLASPQPLQIQGGILGGTGRISATVNNSGELRPGASPGVLAITGDYNQTAAGVMQIELAGLTSDAFDQLTVTGTATLNGSLKSPLLNSFVPPLASTFSFLSAATVAGQFTSHTYPASTVELQLQYAPGSATIRVIDVFTQVSKFPPVLGFLPDRSVDEHSLLTLTATATDADLPTNILSFRLDLAPAGAQLDSVTGVFTWTPTETQGPGTYPITVRVTDNGSLFATQTFTVTVREANQPPLLAPIPPQRIAAGRTLRFTATATDLDLPAQPLSFTLGSGAPPNAVIDPVTGVFMWPVPANQPAGTVTVSVKVTDQTDNPLTDSGNVVITIDRDGPRILSMAPSGVVTDSPDHVDVTFNEPIDPTSFDPTDVTLTGDSGFVPTTVQPTGDNVFRISFALLGPGNYIVKIGPGVVDLAGNPMNQDADGTNGEPVQDVFTGQISVRLADLVVTGITAPAEAVLGQPFAIAWTVKNQGNFVATGPWNDQLSLIDPANPGAELGLATLAVTGTLAPGQSINSTQTVVLPAGISGSRRILIRTDRFSQVAEGPNEANNATEDDQPIQVLASDLIVTTVTGPATARFGQTVPVTWSVKNSGTGPAVVNWTDSIYISPGTNSLAGATLLRTHPIVGVAPLAVGATYTRTQEVTVPVDPAAVPGPYFFVIAADSGGTQPESTEDNNQRSRAIALSAPPLPDLVVSAIITPATAQPGQTVEVQWTVTNQGNLEASGTWSETVSVPDLPPLSTFTYTTPLAPGASLVRHQSITLPLNGPAGPLRFVVETDSGRDVVESNENNNAATADSATLVPAVLTLSMPVAQIAENAPDPTVRSTITRNGSRAEALAVSLISSKPTELTVPATVVIPAGQVTATFALTVHADGVVDGPQAVTIGATAVGFRGAAVQVTVLDTDLPRLTVNFAKAAISEGTSATATVRREVVTTAPLVVQLTVSDDLQLGVPALTMIPANQATVTFEVTALDDTLIEAAHTYTLTAEAAGFLPGSAAIEVTDDDAPEITVQLALHEVSEGAGAVATTGKVVRSAAGPRAVIVALESSNGNAARVPSSVTIPAGALFASFPVAAVDNDQLDGRKTAFIRAYVTDTQTGAQIKTGIPDQLSVLDDDGPTLRLEIARRLVAEGLNPATTATVTRNSANNAPLIVTLISSAPGEATTPPTVTIPIGESTVAFPVVSVNDGVPDGDKTVTLSASAAGFTGGAATLVVTDRNLPDLVVDRILVTPTGATESPFEVSLRIANQGLAAATGPFLQRVYLSSDALIGDDVLLGQADFGGSLPPGQHIDQTFNLRLPRQTGDYWIVVTTDSNDAVAEGLEDNNARISTQPIRVEKTYAATVETDVTVAVAGTAVPLRGRATLIANGQPAPFALVNIHLEVRGTRRILAVLTDADGRFATVFQPLPGEAGHYTVGADHPGVAQATVQDAFTLLGLRLTPPGGVVKIIEGVGFTGTVNVENLSDLPLAGLTAVVIDKPANLQVSLKLATALPGLAEAPLEFTVTPIDTSIRQGIVLIRLSNPDGVTAELRLPVVIESLRPRLTADPGSLVVGMKRGGQTTVQFKVTNAGGAASGALAILPPAIPWLMVGSGGEVPSLAPGESAGITLVLTPPGDLALGDHQGTLVISGAATSLTVPFSFRALSILAGDLKITAVDEYTYYAAGSPNVTNAAVTDAVSGAVVAGGLTDAKGELLIPGLPEAYYRVEVRAEGHGGFHATSLLAAGKTNEVLAFLNRETIKYIWKVVPTEIEDRTKIVIETVFETVVPFPVVTVEPILVDLEELTGETNQIDFKITNHGLVAANHTMLQFEDHPNYSATPLIGDIGTLAAKSSITVPVIIRKLTGGARPTVAGTKRGRASLAAGATSGGCDLRGQTLFDVICGPVKRDYRMPIILRNAGNGGGACGGGGGNGLGTSAGFGLFGGGGGTGFEGGGGTGDEAYTPPLAVDDKPPCRLCPLQTLAAAVGCVVPVVGDILKQQNPSDQFEKGALGKAWEYGKNINDATKVIVKVADGRADAGTGISAASLLVKGLVGYGVSAAKKLLIPVKIVKCIYGVVTACKTASGASLASDNAEASPPAIHSTRRQAAPQADVARPELEPLDRHLAQLQKVVDVIAYVLGDPIWFVDETSTGPEWFRAFLDAVDPSGDSATRISDSERAGLLGRTRPQDITPNHVNRLADRWNRTVEYWTAGRFNQADVPAGQSTEFIALDMLQARLQAADNALIEVAAEGFTSITDAIEAARLDLIRFYKMDAGGGDCATVRLRIEQQAVITRDAFDASLEIVNSTDGSLDDVSVELTVRDETGAVTTSLFGIRPPVLTGLGAVDGTGVVAANSTGKASWIIIPTSEAAPLGPTVMHVSGTLKYSQQGTAITIPLSPAAITVLPNASLKVKYFNQRDVFADDPFTSELEPSIPFSLGVLIQNNGRGAARNVRLTSAQPKIVENEKGLLIDFEILATEVAGRSLSPSLTANFGNIEPGEVAQGRFLLRSSLQGLFIDYKASFEHLDGLGDPRLSLIDSVEIHELIHAVRAESAFEDGKLDFLANDVPDVHDMPDTLHLSDGRIAPVAAVTEGSVNAPPGPGHLQVKLTASLPAGWAYLQISDPADGRLRLTHVRRLDGSEVRPEDNFWTTDRTFIGNGQRPIRENLLHLVDFNSAGTYTLVYEEPPTADRSAPNSTVAALPADSPVQIPVRWSGDDGAGSGIGFFDIFVSINGGPFNPWLQKTLLTGGLYDGKQTERYAFYSVATDRAGNQEAAHTSPDAVTTVNLINTAPRITLPATVMVNEGDTLSVASIAMDDDAPANHLRFSLEPGAPSGAIVDPDTGALTWVTGEGNGPGSNPITVRVTDNGVPSLSATATVRVNVVEVNLAPELDPIPDQHINEGKTLTVAVSARDPDLPANTLTFRLGTDAPAGARITPAGIFTWTPTALQGPSTNRIPVIVSDDGHPSLSATNSFTVVVRDVLGDFLLGIDGTIVLAGQKGGVPIQLSSAVDLTSLRFTLELATARLTNLALKPVAPEIALASLRPTGPDRFRVELICGPGQVLQGNQTVAQLAFDADASGDSAIVPLLVSEIEGGRASGAPLTKATARAGRVILIGHQPLLETVLDPAPVLILYARPGTTLGIEYQTRLSSAGPWTQLTRVRQENTFQKITPLTTGQPDVFYRAFEFVTRPARLEFTPSVGIPVSLLLYGRPGVQYKFQSSIDPINGAAWHTESTLSLKNSFQVIDLPQLPGPLRFFRTIEP